MVQEAESWTSKEVPRHCCASPLLAAGHLVTFAVIRLNGYDIRGGPAAL